MPAPRTDKERFLKLAPRLKALIEFHQVPSYKLAALLEVSTCFISLLCRGEKILAAHKLPRLATFFNLTEEQLLGQAPITETKTLHLP